MPQRGGSMYGGLAIAVDKNLLSYKTVDLPLRQRVFNGALGYVGCNGRAILVHRWVGPSIKQFVQSHPTGRYILRIKKHVFAVIDGKMYDAYKQHGGAEVQRAWEIKPHQ